MLPPLLLMYPRSKTTNALLMKHSTTSEDVLDHLVNNAGISGKPVTVENMRDVSEYTAVMDVNFWGAVNATLFAIPHLKNSEGRIIVIASVCAWFPIPLISIYNASKAAITNFFETLRMESSTAIGITIATPGFYRVCFFWLFFAQVNEDGGLQGATS
ncbi:hypothetical protein V8G54_019510 [Vigna mungo]|uniref:Uncharacterized protein n=1 Tax=Vigna mungo TaxID=3915 RepID=A0AAQ3NAB2_VIGMU